MEWLLVQALEACFTTKLTDVQTLSTRLMMEFPGGMVVELIWDGTRAAYAPVPIVSGLDKL
jgi:hypothetical protein